MPDKQNSKNPDGLLQMDHETLLQTLLHEMHDGVIVCNTDATITLFNKAATDLFAGSQSVSNGDSQIIYLSSVSINLFHNILQMGKTIIITLNDLIAPPSFDLRDDLLGVARLQCLSGTIHDQIQVLEDNSADESRSSVRLNRRAESSPASQ